jgi:hypothetical protein
MIGDPKLTAQIYQMMYHNTPVPAVQVAEYREKSDVVLGETKTQPKSKREELIESLDFLKKKKIKTKQDKESIDLLESVLKNI